MKYQLAVAVVFSALLSACTSDNTATSIPGGAAVVTIAPDYSSGSHAVIAESNGEFNSANNLLPTASDITLASNGNFFYRIERAFAGNNITKFSFAEPQTVIWQYSVKDDPQEAVPSNPTDMVFVNEQKAYVIRYGKDKVWIVNPSAASEAEFKIGEIDLSSYNDAGGVPEMHSAIVINGKLFIAMQRLISTFPLVSDIAYVAVFDVVTDIEIDTNYPGDSVKGIPLEIQNPENDMFYVESENAIYIQAVGTYSPTEYIGGIEKINVDNYDTNLVLDDGTESDHPNGKIISVAVVSATEAYFIGCADCDDFVTGFNDYSLYKLNPATGATEPVQIAALQHTELSDLSLSPTGDLWISAGSATLYIMDVTQESLIATIDTQLNPVQVVFEK